MATSWRNEAKRKYIPRSSSVTSSMMSKVKNRNSKAEMLLRRELWSRKLRYRLHSKKLIGKPDIVFAKKRLVVFVDGDFWHGKALLDEGVDGLLRGLRSERADWWVAKIQKTVARDNEVSRVLGENGWKVFRFWESEVLKDVATIAAKVEDYLVSK